MSTLIFDIETVGEEWSRLDDVTKESLVRWVKKASRDREEQKVLTEDVVSGLGFSPLTGFLVALGIYDLEREKGTVYYVGNGEDTVVGEFRYRPRTEAAMLEEFWSGITQYDTFVTFNGRAFDIPFLFHRSLIHNIQPTRNLLEGRYPYQQKSCRHVDLEDELTFYGAMQRRPNLHLFCRAYGIKSSKGEVSGDKVATLYKEGRLFDIARYNAEDLRATKELYLRWKRGVSSWDKSGA
jgi:DNA polymerase elongation subunit (family B)